MRDLAQPIFTRRFFRRPMAAQIQPPANGEQLARRFLWAIAVVIVAALLLFNISGCTSATEFGPCVGVSEDKNPDLVYKLSANNLTWGILGFGLIAPPVFVLVDETYCPISRKSKAAP